MPIHPSLSQLRNDKSITEVVIDHHYLLPEEIKIIAAALKENQLQGLFLRSCCFDLNSITVLADAIKASSSLRVLNLSKNPPPQYALQPNTSQVSKALQFGRAIGSAIGVSSSLVTALVAGRNIDDDNIIHFARSLEKSASLQFLDLSNNRLTEDGLRILSAAVDKRYNTITRTSGQQINKTTVILYGNPISSAAVSKFQFNLDFYNTRRGLTWLRGSQLVPGATVIAGAMVRARRLLL